MKMRSIRNRRLTEVIGHLFVALSIMLSGCGAEQDEYYDRALKGYGSMRAPTSTGAHVGTDDSADLPWNTSADATASSSHPEKQGSSPAPSPSPTTDETAIDPVHEDPNALPPLPEADPSAPAEYSYFHVSYDTRQVWKLRQGSAPAPAGFLIKSQVQQAMVTRPTDKLILRQNTGDGIALSDGYLTLTAMAADDERPSGSASVSGVSHYERVVGDPQCPSVFICARRLVRHPTVGTANTFCYQNATTGAAAVFPIAVATNYRRSDFLRVEGPIGTYRITKWEGDVSCEQGVNARPLLEETVAAALHVEASLGGSNLPSGLAADFPAQYGVTLTYARTVNDDRAPYIDETLRMDHVSHAYLNEDHRLLVQLIVETRSSLRGVPFVDGVGFKLAINLCRDYMDPNGTNYCPTIDVPPAAATR